MDTTSTTQRTHTLSVGALIALCLLMVISALAPAATQASSHSITSPNNASFTVGVSSAFMITTSGFSLSDPPYFYTSLASLPNGLEIVSNNDRTGYIQGDPGPGTGGVYTFTLYADDENGGLATQSFTLTIYEVPSITSANTATFTVGQAGSFTVTATGYPTPTLSVSGALPSGVTFTPNSNGTATISGTPTASGVFTLTITAANGVNPNATQTFTLTVNQAPSITSANTATFTVGQAGSFTVTATGYPTPTLSVSGALPSGVTFTPNSNGTATISGTPTTSGVFTLTITAANGVNPNATQTFTLKVEQNQFRVFLPLVVR
ncbi:putative Ig domain-containing protein [Roseiflexus sp.]|uniref:putative Ig domain-containing protein n=1 Tax=Roseiflexus sp. TaxID=2562120 RepID=UPI0021DD9EF3|nr:putative Ig domain-containing protein [Roseiflexus sp.]GIW02041.1 MAG: hypothetical protein KatS3mg058_3444 [Roseiflexus sp.]